MARDLDVSVKGVLNQLRTLENIIDGLVATADDNKETQLQAAERRNDLKKAVSKKEKEVARLNKAKQLRERMQKANSQKRATKVAPEPSGNEEEE